MSVTRDLAVAQDGKFWCAFCKVWFWKGKKRNATRDRGLFCPRCDRALSDSKPPERSSR